IPYRPRKDARRVRLLLGEHARRQGDPNHGGVTKTPIVTAYRQEALRCALFIERSGRGSLKALRETGVVPNAARILGRDVYGWFRRVERAVYGLSDRAREDIARFAAAGRLPNVDQQSGKAPYANAAIGGYGCVLVTPLTGRSVTDPDNLPAGTPSTILGARGAEEAPDHSEPLSRSTTNE